MADLPDRIREKLAQPAPASSDYDLNPEIVLPEGRKLREAAVLMPLIRQDEQWRVVLTMRSSALKHHPGQIAFPGGKRDNGDANLEATALREAEEEIALPHETVEIIGRMSAHETVTGFTVTPFVGIVNQPFMPRAEVSEVAEVFSVPLEFLCDSANYHVQYRRWRGQRRYYYTAPFGPYYIWGATARMLRAFADLMEPV